MQVERIEESPVAVQAEAVVVFAGPKNWSAAADAVNEATGGAIMRLAELGEISGKAGECISLLAPQGVKSPLALVVGLGDRETATAGSVFRAACGAARTLAARKREVVAFFADDTWSPRLLEAAVAGSITGCRGTDLYRAEKNRHPFGRVLWSGAAEAVASGEVLGEAINTTRHLVNEPPSVMYPETFAERAAACGEESGFSVEIWDGQRLEAEGCGSLLAVARGSVRDPRLVICRYEAAAADAPLLALVGKGVTFDSGGLSIKPTDGMLAMKCDMAGAATVLGAMQAIARLKLPVNVVGLMGLVENLISGDAYKLGDVLTARSGKTIEVHNTDAEGRLVLADVLDVAADMKPARIVDLATLTGACMVALGMETAGVMSNNEAWAADVLEAARNVGEPAWQLPMFPEYGEQIRSEVADIKNVGEGRWGGAITAAKFLEEFVRDIPWAHIDIAGPAFNDHAKSWLDAGGSGAFVRTLVELARRWPPQ